MSHLSDLRRALALVDPADLTSEDTRALLTMAERAMEIAPPPPVRA